MGSGDWLMGIRELVIGEWGVEIRVLVIGYW